MEAEGEVYLRERRERLASDLGRRVEDHRVLEAFRTVPRHLFVPPSLRRHAYEDRALPLADAQTISQPSMIALMLDQLDLEPHHRALEVGSGSGYAAALLATLVREVHAVEIRPSLAEFGREALASAGITNVRVHVADGSKGLPEQAPFDRILVSAAGAVVPSALLEQLSPAGRIAIPVGDDRHQRLRIGRRSRPGGGVEWVEGVECIFVPLVGAEGR